MTIWQQNMYEMVKEVAQYKQEFTNDDVFDHYDYVFAHHRPVDDRRSYGNVVQKAISDGIMEWNGHAVVSRRKNCHKMLIRVYKSKIYKQISDPVPVDDGWTFWNLIPKSWRKKCIVILNKLNDC